MTLRALFLDVGGTLLRETPSRFEVYARAARRRGFEMSAEAMRERMRVAHAALPPVLEGAFRYSDPWFEAFIRRIFVEDLGLAEAELPGVLEELFGAFEDPSGFELVAGADALFAAVRERGLTSGLVSNWSARLPQLIEALGLADTFDFVLSSALEGSEKPDPGIFRRALELARVRPTEALHVGDRLVEDVQGARNAGLRAALVDPAGRFTGELPPDVPHLADLEELARYILRTA